MRQPREPLAKNAFDLFVAQAIHNALHPPRVVARERAILESLVSDAAFLQLPFEILVAVETDAGGVGKVTGKLDEQPAEVVVVDVEGNRSRSGIGLSLKRKI